MSSTDSSNSSLRDLEDRVSNISKTHVLSRKGKSSLPEKTSIIEQDNDTDDDFEDKNINSTYLKNNIMDEEYDFEDFDEEEKETLQSHPYVMDLTDELKALENELSLYKKSNELLKRSNEEFKERLDLLETEKELAREEMLAREDEKRDMLENSFDIVPKLEKQLEELRRDSEERINSYKSRLSKLSEDYSSTLNNRQMSDEEIQDLKDQVTKLTLERTKLVDLNTKLTSDVDRLSVDYKQLESLHISQKETDHKKIDELEKEAGQLNDQLVSSRGQCAEWIVEYETENKRLESRLKTLSESNRNLEKQNRFLETQKNELQSRKDTLSSERDNLVYELDDITNDIDLTKKKIISAKERFEEQKVQLSAVRSNCSEEMSRLIEENEILKADRDSLESQVKTREHDVESLLTQHEEMERKLTYMGQYLQDLKNVFGEVNDLEPKGKGSSDAVKAREILLHIQNEREKLKENNSNLSNEILEAKDKIQRLEIQLNEMNELVKNFESQSKSVQNSNKRSGSINMGSEDEERLVFLESEVLALRTKCASLEAELTAQKDQVSQLNELRQSFDSTKKLLMDREAEIAELKSKLDLNELEMKSKNLQLQSAHQEVRDRDQNNDTASVSTISSGGNSLVYQYEQMIEEMRTKLDQTNVENGKLRYQLSEAAQKALDSVKSATIQELRLKNEELQRILRSQEEKLIKEQSKSFSKSVSTRPGERTRGEIVEGISELMTSSIYSDDKCMDISLSQDFSLLRNGEFSSNRRSTLTPRRSSVRSVQPEMKSLKTQIDNLNEQLESKNFDLEKALSTARDLSQKLEDARKKIHFMEECVQTTDKTTVMLRDELIRKQQHVADLEAQLQNGKCPRCGGVTSDDNTPDSQNNVVSNRTVMFERDIDATLKNNLQTVEYMDELIRVFAQQNNLSHGNINQTTNDSSSMQNVQSLLEGLYQQTANMQKVMEENAGHLKRLVEAALSNSPSKRQSRLSTRLSKPSNIPNNNSNDTVEVKRQDLQAIIKAGSNIIKTPTQFVSQIENFASAMLDQERNKAEVADGIHLFKELAPALEKYVLKFATFSKLHKELLKDFTASRKRLEDDSTETKNQINVLIASGHELAADNLQLSMQIKELFSLLSNLTDEEQIISNNSASILVVQEMDNHQREIEKLRKLVAAQGQVIADYEANIGLFQQKDEQVKKLRTTLATLTNLKKVDKGSVDPDVKNDLLTKCGELCNLWLQEVETNSTLREMVKELQVSSSSKEKEMKLRIESLITQVNNSSQQLQDFKLQAEKFEEKYHQTESALKEQVQQYEKLRKDWSDLVETHQADLEALKHRWTKERKTLQEANKSVKVQQLAEIEAGHNKLQEAWQKEKETIAKKNRVLKETHQKEIKGLQKEIEKLTSKIKDLDTELSSVSAEKKALTLEKAALTKDRAELQQKVENLEKESVRYQSKQASSAELNKQIRNLQKEKEVSAERLNQKITDLEAALKQEQESKIQLNKIKNNALKEITTLKNQNRVANEIKDSLEEEIRAKIEHMKALGAEIENLTEQLQSERRDHQEKNTQLSNYEDQLQSERERCRELLIKIAKLEKQKSTINNNEHFQLVEENRQLKDELQVLNTKIIVLRKEKMDQEANIQQDEEGEDFKQKSHRESGFRADLCYQKRFLMLLIGGIESCEQATLILIRNSSRITYMQQSLIKFKGAVNAVIAIQRMRILKNNWEKYKNMKKSIQQQNQQRRHNKNN
ncbi:A-kinase anchor protein 9 [Rhizophagus clarus]|uniref:A-kinase anchor protein 9 n=1 Tax=Rhizophagus clarus TaxID=94130 RepID=A0A8H3QPL7_9GLOM|nr:A-kinase anchor protein 9 [Rhizophagus clarus]